MEQLDSYLRAGKIAHSALQLGKRLAKPGEKLLVIAESIESYIREQGAKPAFPVNLSANESAAHYTPETDDASVVGEKDILKIDVGVHVNGYIADTALTVDFSGENGKLIEAAEKALEAAIAAAKPGAKLSDLGAAVEATIKSHGFHPIENLSGHLLGQYELHAGLEIPNISVKDGRTLEEGQAIAIEPFATNGQGRVGETQKVEIFSLLEIKPMRMREARRLLSFVESNYKFLPFAERWLAKEFPSKFLLSSALRELILSGAFEQYPVLKEIKGGLVSQAEHTVIVEHDSARVITR